MCENQEVNYRSPKLSEKNSILRKIPSSPKQSSQYEEAIAKQQNIITQIKTTNEALLSYNEKTKKQIEQKKNELAEERAKTDEKIRSIQAKNEELQKQLIQENEKKMNEFRSSSAFEHEKLVSLKNQTSAINQETEQLRNEFQQNFNNFMDNYKLMKGNIEESANSLAHIKQMKEEEKTIASESSSMNSEKETPKLVISNDMFSVQKCEESSKQNAQYPQRKSKIIEFIEKFCAENAEWLC